MASSRCAEVSLGGRLAVPGQGEQSTQPGLYAICSVCHGPAAASRTTCWSCAVALRQLGAVPPVVPVFLFALGSPVHRALVDYKAAVSEVGRAARAGALSDVLARWLEMHADCLLGGVTNALVVAVPSSTGGRPSWQGVHPLETICGVALAGSARWNKAAVLRPGSRPPRRLEASRHGYRLETPSEVAGRTVVVLDDMFVSGSRAFSAAAALSSAGAEVAAVVPLGRLVRPDHNEATAAYWATRRTLRFDPGVCTGCAPAGTSGRVSAWPIPRCRVSERLAA
jgi:predicted amidophosphoribosyltransferase